MWPVAWALSVVRRGPRSRGGARLRVVLARLPRDESVRRASRARPRRRRSSCSRCGVGAPRRRQRWTGDWDGRARPTIQSRRPARVRPDRTQSDPAQGCRNPVTGSGSEGRSVTRSHLLATSKGASRSCSRNRHATSPDHGSDLPVWSRGSSRASTIAVSHRRLTGPEGDSSSGVTTVATRWARRSPLARRTRAARRRGPPRQAARTVDRSGSRSSHRSPRGSDASPAGTPCRLERVAWSLVTTDAGSPRCRSRSHALWMAVVLPLPRSPPTI